MTLEIFLPYWGDPGLLRETVASVFAQRNPDWRLTILDDHYPDPRAGEWFGSLGDDRVTYVRHPENLGISANYREAVRRASEPYMVLLGSDDLLHRDYVDVITRTAAAVPFADVIQPGVDVIDEHGRPVRPLADRVKKGLLTPRHGSGISVLSGQSMATSLIRGDWLYWPSLAFRTETLKRIDFREGLPIIQDLALLMDVAFAGGTLAYNPSTAFSYRRHARSASQQTLLDGTRFRDERRYYAIARELASERGWVATARAARLRVMSRLHAVTELPTVIGHRNARGIQSTLAHIVAP